MSGNDYGNSHRPCVACGKVHGGVQAHLLCLEFYLVKYRDRVVALDNSKKEYDRIPTTRGGMFEELKRGKKKT